MPNVFISSEIGSQWRTTLGHPQMIECMGIWRMDLIKGVTTLFAHCEKVIWKFFFKFKQGTSLWIFRLCQLRRVRSKTHKRLKERFLIGRVS